MLDGLMVARADVDDHALHASTSDRVYDHVRRMGNGA